MNICWSGTILALEPSPDGQRAVIELPDCVLKASVPLDRELGAGQTVEIALRVDEISLSASTDTDQRSSALSGVHVAATVVQEQARGVFHVVTVRLPSQARLEIPIPRWQRRELELAADTPITLLIPDAAVHLFSPQE